MVVNVQTNQEFHMSTLEIFFFPKWHAIWVETHFVHANHRLYHVYMF